MRVLVSAYACNPTAGSEPGAGWAWACAAAQRHDVWVLTRQNNSEAINDALRISGIPSLHPVYIDLPLQWRRWKRGQRHIHLYYLIWQLLAWREGLRLHQRLQFDVAHHVTFAVDWMPAGLAFIRGLPFVWGPVGGTAPLFVSSRRWLGRAGVRAEMKRQLVTRIGRRIFGDATASRADLILAQNREVARRFRRTGPVRVEPNVALDIALPTRSSQRSQRGDRHAVWVGRLLAFKGIRAALAALACPEAQNWTLLVFGDGPEMAQARDESKRLGLNGRVRFRGVRPRTEVLAAIHDADSLLFTSFHDSAPWAVGEAVTLGCPVVCLNHTGPAVLVGAGQGIKVPVQPRLAKRLAEALRDVRPALPSDRWHRDRLPDFLDDVYFFVTGDATGAP
jgi:glycosyltransferase involved in cell wall biosynthesis